MGVRGLTTFVDDNFTKWQRQVLQGYVVIDGSSLCHYLYDGLDWAHGGQYPEFRHKVLDCFTMLLRLGIRPVVVMDGIDHTGEKHEVVLRRRKEWIVFINTKLGNNQTRPPVAMGRVIPMLSLEVFQEAIKELHVPLYVVDGEADCAIVEIANFFSCPVVSRDSDFFLFNLRAGYIPLDRFHWQADPATVEVFNVRFFTQQFDLQDDRFCYLIPAVVGNDFLSPYNSKSFTEHVTEATLEGRISIVSVVKYACKFSSLDELLSDLPSKDRAIMERRCVEAQQLYRVASVADPENLLASTIFKLPSGSDIPPWLLGQYRDGSLPCICMHSLVTGRCVLRTVVEDAQKPTAVDGSRELRQFAYALLGRESVTEFYRHGVDLSGETNRAIFPSDLKIPDLASLPGLATAERVVLMYRLLECNPDALSKLEHRWRLVASAIVYWVRKCQPPRHLVKALILCILLCSETKEVLQWVHRMHPLSKLHGHRKTPKWMEYLRAFAQWQSVFFDAVTLNNLLMSPLQFASPAYLYDGELAMSFAFLHDISACAKSYPVNRAVYTRLVEMVESHNVTPAVSLSSRAESNPSPVSRGKMGTKAKVVQERVQSRFAGANRFALLDASDSEDSEDSESD